MLQCAYRWTFTAAILLGLATPILADGLGAVEGQFILDGDVPDVPPLVKKGDKTVKDAEVCAANAVPDDALAFDKETGGIANIFVYMRRAPSNMPAELKESPVKEIVFDQIGCRFVPHGLIVRTDQVIICKSADAVAHNLHTNPFANTPENFIVQPNDRKGMPVKMPSPESLPVKVQCDIHPWMGAWWVVVDHPYAAVTDAEGKFRIENLPEGEHEFRVWHEKAGYIDRKLKVNVKAGETTKLSAKKVPLSSFQK